MNPEIACEACRLLLGNASVAIKQQLRAIARLDQARMRQETERVALLEAELEEAQLARENAVAAYQEHRHRAHTCDGVAGTSA